MEVVGRASITFLFLFLITRGMKKRTLGDMAPFELLLLVTLGDIVQQGITQEDQSVTGSILAVCTFGFWTSAITWLTWRSRKAARILDGSPLVIVHNGEPIDAALKVERLPLEEVLEAARQQGLEDLTRVKLAVLEPSGRISFIKKDD